MSKGCILMVVSKYRGVGGAEIVINNLCTHLNKLGYKTAIGAFTFAEDPPDNIEKVKLHRFAALSLANTKKFDIIHIHEGKMIYYCLFGRRRVLFHYHGANGFLQQLNLQLAMKLCRNRLSRIISVSYSGLEDLKNLLGDVGVDVIYNGVDIDFYNVSLHGPYKKGEPQLLFVGNLYPTKNVEKLIEAMSKIVEIFPKAHLQVVGHGAHYQRLEEKIKEKKLENKVELVGKVSNEELRLRYSSCDVYISASTFEVCPIPPLEAMSCGKPLALSDINPHKEMIKASNAGLTFSLDDSDMLTKIQKVYENRKSYSSAGRMFAEKNNWSEVSKKITKIYDDILLKNR